MLSLRPHRLPRKLLSKHVNCLKSHKDWVGIEFSIVTPFRRSMTAFGDSPRGRGRSDQGETREKGVMRVAQGDGARDNSGDSSLFLLKCARHQPRKGGMAT